MRSLLRKLKFLFLFFIIPLWRRILIFFKKDRSLQKVTLEYYREWKFNQSYLILFFKYENALYYKINGITYFNAKLPAVIPITQQETTVLIEIYGYKQLLNVQLNYEVDWEMKTTSFKTETRNLTLMDIDHKLIYQPKQFNVKNQEYKVKSDLEINAQSQIREEKIHISIPQNQLKITEFNLNDYI